MERPQGKSAVTYGSYDQSIVSAEVGVPFTLGGRRAGFYAFGQFEDSNSFYDGIYSKSKLGQIAFDMELRPALAASSSAARATRASGRRTSAGTA